MGVKTERFSPLAKLRTNKLNKICHLLWLTSLGISIPSLAAEYEQGVKQYQAENYEEALPLFKSALQSRENINQIHLYLGATYIQLLEYKQAKTHLLKATRLQADNGQAWLLLADTHYTLVEYKQASKALEQAEALLGKNGQGEYLYGLILFKGNDYRPAQARFEKAAQIDPNLQQKALYYIALSHLNLGNNTEAQRYFAQAHDIEPNTETALAAQRAQLTIGTDTQDQRKPHAVSVGYAIEYDDNVVLKPSSTIANLQISNEDDVRHVLRLDGRYDKSLGGNKKIRMGYKLYQSNHVTLSTYDLRSHTLKVEPIISGNNDEKKVAIAYDHMSLNNDKYMTRFRVTPSYSRDYKNGDRGTISLDLQNIDYATEPANTAENRDSNNVNLGYYHYRFFKQRSYALLGYKYSNNSADGNNWDFQGHKFLATLHGPLSEKLSATLLLDYQMLDFSNTHNTLNQAREDDDYTLSATLHWKHKALSLMAQALYNNNDSNLAIYDYKRNIAKLGISYRF